VEVVDRDGWRKVFALKKAIVSIGSDPRNELVLEPSRGTGVAARHLQLISLPDGPGYRLINMGDTEVKVGPNGETTLGPRAFSEIGPEAVVKVGDFTLTLHGGGYTASSPRASAGRGSDKVSNSIGLQLNLPVTTLSLDQPIEGSVLVRNLGDKTGVQFRLEVDGLDPAYVEIGPSPILFPNAEKEVTFRLRHPQGSRPAAGDFRLRLRATAPGAYPGQSATASATIQVAPYFQHEIHLEAAD
jgi:hypothetical protein